MTQNRWLLGNEPSTNPRPHNGWNTMDQKKFLTICHDRKASQAYAPGNFCYICNIWNHGWFDFQALANAQKQQEESNSGSEGRNQYFNTNVKRNYNLDHLARSFLAPVRLFLFLLFNNFLKDNLFHFFPFASVSYFFIYLVISKVQNSNDSCGDFSWGGNLDIDLSHEVS